MFDESVYENRVNKLRKILDPHAIYLFSNPSQIVYLTGFQFLVPSEREAFLVVGENIATLIHTSFAPLNRFDYLTFLSGSFPHQLKEHLDKIVNEHLDKNVNAHLDKIVSKSKPKQLYYDPQTLFVSELDAIAEIAGIKYQAMPQNLVRELMINKEKSEIRLIKKACEITHQVFEIIRTQIKVGMSEIEICELINKEFKRYSVNELAFPTIVAFGANSSKPHHQPGNTTLDEDSVVLIDFGAKCDGYCADMTRTFWFGPNPSDEFKKIESIVIKAHNLALKTLKKHPNKNVNANNIDNSARSFISNQGFGDNFIHTTGHGLGIDIHEQPSLSWTNTMQISPNLTITIEPGIYLEGNFGYRHEDTVLTTSNGIKILTKSGKS